MKKLLSILTITTLTSSIPAPLLANTVQTRVKRDVMTSKSNNDYLPIRDFVNIRGDIYTMAIDSKNNIYFGLFARGAFILKHEETTPIKIDGINGVVNAIAVDIKNNIYFGSFAGAFVLKHGETTPTKINEIKGNITSIAVDSKGNIYYSLFQNGVFVLKNGKTIATKIDGISNNIQTITIDTKDNIYFGMYQNSAFVLKHGETTPTKIDGIETIRSVSNIYLEWQPFFGQILYRVKIFILNWC